MTSRCWTSPFPFATVDDCLAHEAALGPGPGALFAQPFTERGADGNFARHAIRPADPGPFDRRLVLTFDDGPHPTATPAVLDVLRAHQIRAAFFIHGERLDHPDGPALIRRMKDEGHIVGNHAERHDNFARFPERAGPSVARTHARLTAVNAPHEPRFFRFPGGNATPESIGAVEALGYAVVGWHGDTMDWCYADRGAVGSCDLVPARFRRDPLGQAVAEAERSNGGILLLHDDRPYTASILDRILGALRDARFRFTTLDNPMLLPRLNDHAQQLNPRPPGGAAPEGCADCDEGAGLVS